MKLKINRTALFQEQLSMEQKYLLVNYHIIM